MKLRKLTATFGCLDGAVLEPEPGLSRWVLPNESGKSTWAAFLLAMFYGIDTGRRASRGHLPDKIKYQPWSGKPMAGTVELEQDGRRIVLQRTSERGRPLGVFRAYDPDTGLELPELTAETCGKTLLGVERAVYARSAFLSGRDLAVTQDQDLARRLGALAASGEETDSYPAAETRLRQWQNRCRYHQTGRIPETRETLDRVEAQLQTLGRLRQARMETAAELHRTQTVLEETRAQVLEEQARSRAALRQELEEANGLFETRASQAAMLPGEERLQQLLLQLQKELPPENFDGASCPPALENLEPEELLPRAQADADRCRAADARRALGPVPALILGAVLALAGGLLALYRSLWWIPALAGAMSLLIYGPLARRKQRERRRLRTEILASYGAETPEQLASIAVAWRDRLLVQAQWQQASWEQELLLEEVQRFAPAAESLWEAQRAIEQALRCHRSCREAEQAAREAQVQWQLADRQPEDETVRDLEQQVLVLRTRAEALAGQEQDLGDWDRLQSRRQTLTQELQDLELREQALILAREALERANEAMTAGYAPRLTGLAGRYLRKLTLGRYDGLVMERDLSLSVREQDSGLLRTLDAVSRGTQDQTWLALRLAMTELLLPPDAPLVLDDALLTFDQEREQAALAVLGTLQRQVLLFSCR